ncbi:FtsB family cell division protein [Cardinium endosymbiont of Sogatella furcifera]|uniref:FtsB family cell division protein n=1 Tax=Cardinium endosymbiont of Sogatella furcifera TaxID=650378 RepID=UPI000E0D4945|nr:septum formation initiator family protein [Cardinium endosymbiont of Sogatella furcifera]
MQQKRGMAHNQHAIYHKSKMRLFKKVWLDPYCIVTILFVVWMCFLDDQNLFVQYRLYQRWQKLQTDVIDYNLQIKQIKKEKVELMHNMDCLEKFAREKYYMKREQEDVYVIIRE